MNREQMINHLSLLGGVPLITTNETSIMRPIPGTDVRDVRLVYIDEEDGEVNALTWRVKSCPCDTGVEWGMLLDEEVEKLYLNVVAAS